MSPFKVITISLITFFIVSVISTLFGVYVPILSLNENQILYLFSTSAQVLAGIYGLTLTGFIFFRNELSREEFDDDTLAEAVESLKERYFSLLVFITCFSIFTLFMSNVAISIESSNYQVLNIVFINIAQVSYIINLLAIGYFIFDVIAPKRIEKASKSLQQEVDPNANQEVIGSLEDFLKNFNQLEYILQKYGNKFQNKSSNSYNNNRRRFSLMKLAEIIYQSEKITAELFEELINLVKLRNSIVNGADPVVSERMVQSSKTILLELGKSLNVVINE